MSPQRRNIIAVIALVALLAAIRIAVRPKSHPSEAIVIEAGAFVPEENIARADSINTELAYRDSISRAQSAAAKSQRKKVPKRPPSRNYLDDAIKSPE